MLRNGWMLALVFTAVMAGRANAQGDVSPPTTTQSEVPTTTTTPTTLPTG